MKKENPNIGLVCNKEIRQRYPTDPELSRLKTFAKITWQEFNESSDWDNHPSYTKESENKGLLFASGLITGEALMGIMVALPIFLTGNKAWWSQIIGSPWIGVVPFIGVIIWLYKSVSKK